jgi:CheY-like chemotaxis protein
VNRRILLIDTDPAFRASLAQQLERYRFDVAAEPDADRAFALAATAPPDLVMVAVEEPDEAGFKVFQRYKKGALRSVPIMLVTASVTPEIFAKHKCLKIHADDYLDKRSLADGELLGKIDGLIGLGEPADEPADTSAWSALASPPMSRPTRAANSFGDRRHEQDRPAGLGEVPEVVEHRAAGAVAARRATDARGAFADEAPEDRHGAGAGVLAVELLGGEPRAAARVASGLERAGHGVAGAAARIEHALDPDLLPGIVDVQHELGGLGHGRDRQQDLRAGARHRDVPGHGARHRQTALEQLAAHGDPRDRHAAGPLGAVRGVPAQLDAVAELAGPAVAVLVAAARFAGRAAGRVHRAAAREQAVGHLVDLRAVDPARLAGDAVGLAQAGVAGVAMRGLTQAVHAGVAVATLRGALAARVADAAHAL